ncbi:MAG: 1-deoxy-D-xylulose-5-phosphate reductoisomerase [Bacteroidales bacterium]|nr:1-deoxy-D-xylulose-5-phosphate reductoisomerase [Bacteroidales bacterium]
MTLEKRKIAILGSTGSIGTQTLDVIRRNPDRFSAEILVANKNWELLAKQAIEFQPNAVVIADKEKYPLLRDALEKYPIKVFAGSESVNSAVEFETVDMVLAAMVGYSGLVPTVNALRHKKPVALANKETLVAAGKIVISEAAKNGVPVLPVDSEHSAIFQSLVGEGGNAIEKILLTASGGPFRGKTRDYLKTVKKEQALKHPNWNMGAKVTIDSASLMNKGLETIEAMHLFNVPVEKIEVLIHPQSIIHSGVEFEDGSVKMQLGMPDMRLPIQYAIGFPDRLKSDFPRVDFFSLPQGLTFEKPDLDTFRNLSLAMYAAKKGGNLPCIMNAANEIAVKKFLENQIGFLEISDLIESVMEKTDFIENPTLEDITKTHSLATEIALSHKIKSSCQ